MKNNKKVIVIVIVSILLLIISSCSQNDESWIEEREMLNDRIISQTKDITDLNKTISDMENEAVRNETLLNECIDENQKDEIEIIELTASENPINPGAWALLESYNYDFDKDGTEDIVQLFTSATTDDNNIIMWDDGQYFVLTVTIRDKIFTLVNEYVQIGRVYFSIFDDAYPGIIVTVSTFAGLKLSRYNYDSNNMLFETMVLLESGNLNIIHNSIPWD